MTQQNVAFVNNGMLLALTGGSAETIAMADLSDKALQRRFAERLKQARVSRGFDNAAEFARALGVEPATYREWEKPGKRTPSPAMIFRILSLLHVSADFLVMGTIPAPPSPSQPLRIASPKRAPEPK